MTRRTLDEANQAIDDLLVRVNAIDGTSLPDPAAAELAKLRAEIEGLRETINQAVLALESDLTELKSGFSALRDLVYRSNGLPLPV